MLKLYALCLTYALYILYEMSNNHVESAKLHICSFIQLTFATLNEVMIYYNGNLSYLHAIHGESHMHSDARMHTNKHAIRSD